MIKQTPHHPLCAADFFEFASLVLGPDEDEEAEGGDTEADACRRRVAALWVMQTHTA